MDLSFDLSSLVSAADVSDAIERAESTIVDRGSLGRDRSSVPRNVTRNVTFLPRDHVRADQNVQRRQLLRIPSRRIAKSSSR